MPQTDARYRELDVDSEYLYRLENGLDWREQIEGFAEEVDAELAWFNGMGACTDAVIWFYDQETKEYLPKEFDEPFEIAMAVGNVTWLDGERFAHTHVLLTREDGSAVGGHLESATAFAGEVYLRSFTGSVERAHDPEVTDLDLWSDGDLPGKL
ncbi:MAG: PPC domain-containing DNA-binding protein [Halobacteriota archaeon]